MELADPLLLADSNGMPLWHSVIEEDPVTKESVARYKQLTLFSREDFVRVWKYWNGIERKAGWMKQELEKRYAAQFKGEKLTQHELFDKQEEQETVVIKPTEINPPSNNEKLRTQKPR